jgi:type I restriction enzyme S subunit
MTTVAEKARDAYGELPEGWTRRRLRFDVRLNPKKSSLDMEPDELVSFVSMDAVGEYGGLNLDDVRELAEVYNGYTYFADGDLCIAKITPSFENGKGALAEGLTNGVGFGTTELHVVRPGPSIDRRFLFYVSIADDFRKLGESEMYGAGGQKRIDEGFIKDWMPSLPPLDTQRRIARFLDEKTARIDGLVEKKRTLLDRLAEKRQALITRAVTKGLNPGAPPETLWHRLARRHPRALAGQAIQVHCATYFRLDAYNNSTRVLGWRDSVDFSQGRQSG